MNRLDNYSQHFLANPKFVKKLISFAKLPKTKTILDIGAGSGIISSQLAESGFKNIIAIEPEKQTFNKLKQNLSKYSQIKIINQDFLNFNLPNQEYNIFANIPFHLSSEIINKLVLSKNPPKKVYLIVQKQFAEKLLINKMNFVGQIGASIAPWYSAKIKFILKSTDFTPPPAVDTVLLELKLKSEPLLSSNQKQNYFNFIQNCYHSPIFFKKHYKFNKKPSQLKLEDWLKIYK